MNYLSAKDYTTPYPPNCGSCQFLDTFMQRGSPSNSPNMNEHIGEVAPSLLSPSRIVDQDTLQGNRTSGGDLAQRHTVVDKCCNLHTKSIP